MSGAAQERVIERMARAAPDATPVSGPARTLRLAIARAAMAVAGLPLTALGVADDVMALDDLLNGLGDDEMLVALDQGGKSIGLATIDADLRAALIERQTMCALLPATPEPRPVTAADAALSVPLIAAFLSDLSGAACGISSWVKGVAVGRRLSGPTQAALSLSDGRYREVRLTVDFGVGERQGALSLALPAGSDAGAPDPAPNSRQAAFGNSVLEAPVVLNAVLHRLHRTLAEVEAFEVGQVLPLDGATVADLRLEAVDGSLAARGRLGQSTGVRAVRIETPAPKEMRDAPVASAAIAAQTPGTDSVEETGAAGG